MSSTYSGGRGALGEGRQPRGNVLGFVFCKDRLCGKWTEVLAFLVGLPFLENSLGIPSLGWEAQPWALG